MIAPVLLYLASLGLRLWSAIARPDQASCPRAPGWWINGVRPSGEYECLLTRGDNDDPAVASLSGRIHCDPGTAPRVVDERHVRCRR